MSQEFVVRGGLLVLLSIVVAGCSTDRSAPAAADAPQDSGPPTYRIAVIPKATSLQFWKSVRAGAERAARDLGGVEIVWKGPARKAIPRGRSKSCAT